MKTDAMNKLARLIWRKTSLTLTLFCFFFPVSGRALCLDNRHPTIQGEFSASRYVAIGIVSNETLIPDPDDPAGYLAKVYDFKVTTSFKGRSRKMKIVSENTSSRFPMTVGGAYVVFLRSNGDETYVDSCGNSGDLKASGETIRKIRHLLAHKSE